MKVPLALVYATGALIAAERNERRMWALHTRALQRGVRPIVPSACLVEAWRGVKQHSLCRLLDGCEIEALAGENAKRAGALRRGLPSGVGPVNATVVEVAVRRRGAIVTSDRPDIEVLAAAARRRIHVIDM